MIDLTKPVNLSAPDFINNKYEYYERIREERPVHKAKVSVLTVYTVARHEDCTNILKDPRVLRKYRCPGRSNLWSKA
jgi:cytochrome P450